MNAILARRYEIHASLLIKNILLLLCDYPNPRAMHMYYAGLDGSLYTPRYPPWPIQ